MNSTEAQELLSDLNNRALELATQTEAIGKIQNEAPTFESVENAAKWVTETNALLREERRSGIPSEKEKIQGNLDGLMALYEAKRSLEMTPILNYIKVLSDFISSIENFIHRVGFFGDTLPETNVSHEIFDFEVNRLKEVFYKFKEIDWMNVDFLREVLTKYSTMILERMIALSNDLTEDNLQFDVPENASDIFIDHPKRFEVFISLYRLLSEHEIPGTEQQLEQLKRNLVDCLNRSEKKAIGKEDAYLLETLRQNKRYLLTP